MKRWILAAKKADFDAIAHRYNITPMLARIIRNRDVVDDEDINAFLNGQVSDMHDPRLLKDVDKAAQRIIDAIQAHEKIRIIGDYDVDGVCSSYILVKAFECLGADVSVKLPDRIIDGYGLNRNLINAAKADGVNLIVTCDNGIAAYDEIEYANSLGIDVVVTDHHEIPAVIPPALAVVNPHQQDCPYPFKGICGGMVAYKLIVYIKSKYDALSVSLTDEIMEEFLVFAAFATVEDIMDILDENRIAVKHGIAAMANCRNLGLRALIEVCGLDKNNISVYQIGFVLGPCMNATGRLDTAERALELLREQDYERAVVMAQELKDLNENRKNMTIMYADMAIEIAGSAEYANDNVLVLYIPECHESLAGIVAGRVRERFYKPTIILTRAAEGVKGSARSIDDYNIFAELSKVKDLFTRFGGHKMAAGLSTKEEYIPVLRQRLNDACGLTKEQLVEKCLIDIPLPIAYATLDFAREINRLAPFGKGNPKPLFAQKDVKFDNLRLMGKNSNVLKMALYGTDASGRVIRVEGILFDNAQETFDAINNRTEISILYQIDINTYQGRENVQLVIQDWY